MIVILRGGREALVIPLLHSEFPLDTHHIPLYSLEGVARKK
jgi:hypothetical protein